MQEKTDHDIAQICLNGHVINTYVTKFPQFNQQFCHRCGAPTTTNSPNCHANIRGRYHVEGSVLEIAKYIAPYSAPAFCPDCGRPYPWTETKIQAARDLVEALETISKDEKVILAQSIGEVVRDTPTTTVAATRMKRILSKTGGSVANAFRDILVDMQLRQQRRCSGHHSPCWIIKI